MQVLTQVEEYISNVYENGYGAEIEALSHYQLACDMIDCGVFHEDELYFVVQAIEEFRNND